MTYGMMAAALLILALLWVLFSGRGGARCVDAMDAAIVAGDEAALTALLKKHPRVAACLSDTTFLLVKAIMQNRAAMVQELLDLGHRAADLQRCAREHDVDLLNVAIRDADADVLRMLLAAGIKETEEETAPLLMCYIEGRPEHLTVLQRFEATRMAESQNEAGLTPLHAAAIRFEANSGVILQMVRALLKSGANVNALTTGGNTPLDFAMDVTHRGAGEDASLARVLLEYGAKSGRSIRVPVPAYCGRVYFASLPDSVPGEDLPPGCKLELVQTPVSAAECQELLEQNGIYGAPADRFRAHVAYIELVVQGAAGEDPLRVADRAMELLVSLASLPGIVGVQMQRTLLADADLVLKTEDAFSPFLYASLRFARYKKDYVWVDTAGLASFGLPELELIVPCKGEGRKHRALLAQLVADLSSAAVSGRSAWEPGHTATLSGRFCRISYGKHSITDNEGFVFVVDK